MRRNSLQEGDGPGSGGSRLRVLVVDRSPERADAIADALQDAGLTPAHVADDSPDRLAEEVARGWDVLVAPDKQAGAVRAAVRHCGGDAPGVVVRAQNAAN